MAITCAMNWVISGQLTPATMRSRQFLFSHNAGRHEHIYFLGQTFIRMTKTWSFVPAPTYKHGFGLLLGITVCLLFTLLVFFALRHLCTMGAKRTLLLCAWALLIELLYFAVLPSMGHGGRYI
jgi:hypothetical protein